MLPGDVKSVQIREGTNSEQYTDAIR